MYELRELTLEEMDLVSGGYLGSEGNNNGGTGTSNAYNGSGSFLSSGSQFSTSLGSTSGGWTFGVANNGQGLGIWTQSPSGQHTFHLFQGSSSYNFNSNGFSLDVNINPGAGGTNNNVDITFEARW